MLLQEFIRALGTENADGSYSITFGKLFKVRHRTHFSALISIFD